MGDEQNSFLESFEREIENDLERLGTELNESTGAFIQSCIQKHGDSVESYVECRRARDSFLKQEMSNLSFRIKFLKYQTESCIDTNGTAGIAKCSSIFKANLHQAYLLSFNNINNFTTI